MKKGVWFLAPVLGVPLIAIVVLLFVIPLGILSLGWVLDKIFFIAILGGFFYLIVQRSQKKPFTLNELFAILIVCILTYLGATFGGFLAMGFDNQQNVEISIDSGKDLLLSSYGYTDSWDESGVMEESTFSFTCEPKAISDLFGCRFAPGTYRPFKMTVKNTDSELPLPACIIAVTVDTEILKANQDVRFLDLENDYPVSHGEVFLVNSNNRQMWDGVIDWVKKFSGDKDGKLDQRYGSHTVFIYSGGPIAPGEERTFGLDDEGNPTLFVVADQGAKLGDQHLVQVALIETAPHDDIMYGDCKGLWGCTSYTIQKIMFLPVKEIANFFDRDVTRTVFAVAGFNFVTEMPKMEIYLVLGVIGVVGLLAFGYFRGYLHI